MNGYLKRENVLTDIPGIVGFKGMPHKPLLDGYVDPDPYKYQVRMWAFSNTIRQ